MQQVIWITGASSGIGEAVAVNNARRGQVRLILSSRRTPELERVKRRCVDEGLEVSEILVLPLDIVATEVSADGIDVSIITPGLVATEVSANTLRGDGERFGITDKPVVNGMSAEACAEQIVDSLINKVRDIAVGEAKDMAVVALKREDPEACFDHLNAMAAMLRAEGIY